MLNKKVSALFAGLVLAGFALAGCSSPSDEVPADNGSVVEPDTSSPSTDGGDVVVTGPSDAEAADVTVSVSDLADGATVTYPVGSLVLVDVDDPTKYTLASMDTAVVSVESIKADNSAGYNLGFRVVSAGSAQLGVFTGNSTATVTVVGE